MGHRRHPLPCLALALASVMAGAGSPVARATAAEPGAARQQQLVRMVRQDCGSCHGMRLTGGLGPALTREALAGLPAGSLAATILQGRPGTPMPPWQALLSPADADWIAARLLAGFPEDAAHGPRLESPR